jgi:4-hydroxy-tetrahydrodipicolinate reductase
MIEIILHGCCGKMGQAVVAAAESSPEISIIYGVDRNLHGNHPFPVYFPINDGPEKGDVIIDFSSHEAVPSVLDFAVSRKLPLVLASTGLTDEEQDQIRKASQKIPVFQAPNFSVGINLIAA